MTEQPESPQPPQPGDVPAAVRPDAPTEVQASDETATVVDQPALVSEPAPHAATPPPPVPHQPTWTPPTWTPDAEPEPEPASGIAAVVAQRPEVAVGGAFAGGLVLALILKRLAR